MKGFIRTVVGAICLVIMIIITYFAYKLPVFIGFDNPSRILGIVGFILSLRISMIIVQFAPEK